MAQWQQNDVPADFLLHAQPCLLSCSLVLICALIHISQTCGLRRHQHVLDAPTCDQPKTPNLMFHGQWLSSANERLPSPVHQCGTHYQHQYAMRLQLNCSKLHWKLVYLKLATICPINRSCQFELLFHCRLTSFALIVCTAPLLWLTIYGV